MDEFQLEEFVLREMPSFVAVNYKSLLETAEAREKVRLACHIYNLGLRVLTISLVSQYLTRDKNRVSNPYLNELLLQKFPRLTLDAWKGLFFASLRAYEGKRDLFFMPELYDFYWDTSAIPHRRRVEVETLFDRLTQIATEFKLRQDLPADESGWDELARETIALLSKTMRRFAFVGDYDLIRVLDYDKTCYTFELHKGLTVSKGRSDLPRRSRIRHGWFYLRRSTEQFLPLHPLLVFWKSESEENERQLTAGTDTGVYDRFVYERLRYLLTTGDRTVTGQRGVTEFVRMIFNTIEEEKVARIRSPGLTWWQLRDLCENISKRRMATVEGKYNPNLHLRRDEIWRAFDDFLASEKRCFVLIGKSGVGKSSFLLNLGEELCRARDDVSVLMYDGGQLQNDPTITDTINNDFSDRLVLSGRRVEHIWREIAKIYQIDNRIMLLFVDAINESSQARDLLLQLDELVRSPWPWLKIVLSSRPETWQEIRHGARLAEAMYYRDTKFSSPGDDLAPFSHSREMRTFSNRELPRVYANYQREFGLKTNYEDLPHETRDMLRDPLNLWLVAKTYEGGGISTDLRASELVEHYIAALLRSERLERKDLHLLSERLVPLMVREDRCVNALSIGDIDEAGGTLFEEIYSEQVLSSGRRINQSFLNLLDADILTRQGVGREQQIAFKYERFYEHFAGRRLAEIAQEEEDLVLFFRYFIDQINRSPFVWGAVARALYLTLDKGQVEVIKELCRTKDRQTAYLATCALIQYSDDQPGITQAIAQDLLLSRKGGFLANDMALKVALHLGDKDTLVKGLISRNRDISDQTTRYVYILNKMDPQLCLEILEALVDKFRYYGLPNISVIRTTLLLESILLLENITNGTYDQAFHDIIEKSIRRLLYADKRGPIGRFARSVSMKLALSIFNRLVRTFRQVEVMKLAQDWESAFSLSDEERAPVLELIPYLDYRYGTCKEIEELMPQVISLDNHLISNLLFVVINVRGSQDPDEVLPLLRFRYRMGYHGSLGAIYSWEICTTYHDQMKPEWLEVQRDFVSEFYEEYVFSREKCPDIRFDEAFPAYPLMCYASIWNRLYPDQEIDLIKRYLERATEREDRTLILHIIDGFGDSRFRLSDYRAPLRSLIPFVSSPDDEIREHLIQTLACLHGPYPNQVSHFLFEADAPRIFRERVRQDSHAETIVTMYRRINLFFRSAMLNLPSDTIQLVVDVLDEAGRQRRLSDALEIAFGTLVNELGGGEVL